jgi:hypothetical protein
MKIDVEANDFCPDNCKNCELFTNTTVLGNGEQIREYRCKNMSICKTLYENMNNTRQWLESEVKE